MNQNKNTFTLSAYNEVTQNDQTILIPIDTVIVPKEATRIEFDESYAGFDNLKSIIVEEGNSTYYVNNNCLINKNTKSLVVAAANANIPCDGSIEKIATHAFSMHEEIEEIVIPEGVKIIDELAFCTTHPNKIVIPASVEKMYAASFWPYFKSIDEISIDKNNKHYYAQSGCVIERKTNSVIFFYGENPVIPEDVSTVVIDMFSVLATGYNNITIPASAAVKVDVTVGAAIGITLRVHKNSVAEKYCLDYDIEYSLVD